VSGVSNETITPLSLAITTCPTRRDHGRISAVYAKFGTNSCSEINLKEKAVGTICKTAMGQFKRVEINGEFGIQDLGKNGKVWFDAITLKVNQDEATTVCSAKTRQSLPTTENFELAESRGFREAFSGDVGSKFFWSSSVHPDYDDSAYGFSGGLGGVVYDNRYIRFNKYSACCVSAAGVN